MLTIHANCIAVRGIGVLLTGASGSGKSDLSLRMIACSAQLVADDYTIITVHSGGLIARAPPQLMGKIEMRGIGIVELPAIDSVKVGLHIALDQTVPRLPEAQWEVIAGISLPSYALAAFEDTALLKIDYLITQILGKNTNV